MCVGYYVADFYPAAAAVQRGVDDVGSLAVLGGDGGKHGDTGCGTEAANVADEDVGHKGEFAEGEGEACGEC